MNNGRKLHGLIFYSLWDPKEVEKVIGKPSFKFSLLRDPVDAFESGFVYMGIGKNHKSGREIDINEYAETILMLRYPQRAPKGNNFLNYYIATIAAHIKATLEYWPLAKITCKNL